MLHGAGSSLYGADAFGGTINIITRRTTPASASIEVGSWSLVSGRAQASGSARGVQQLVSGAVSHSEGFMFERQFDAVDLLSRTSFGRNTTLSVSHLRKDFGANGFYGAAPSHEWTNQTRVAVEQRLGRRGGWDVSGVASYRTHGDHFLFNVQRPGVSENFHRSHAVLATIKGSRAIGPSASVTVGGEAGGDWIRSTNLRDHATNRVSAFGE